MRQGIWIAAASVLTIAAAGCGTTATVDAKTIRTLIAAMIQARVAAVSFQLVPPGQQTLTPGQQHHLIAQEKALLAHIYEKDSVGYRHNLAFYRQAALQLNQARRLNPHVSAIHIISVTQNNGSASVEWSAALTYQRVHHIAGNNWGSPTTLRRQLTGTTIMRSGPPGWRISSTAGAPIL